VSCSRCCLGYLLEWAFFSFLYEREHLQQVLMTYGLILVFEELRSLAIGDEVHGVGAPAWLSGSVQLGGLMAYPVYRLFISGVCVALALGLYAVLSRTRLGMMIRAGSSNREMVSSLGIDVKQLFRVMFAAGVALAVLAGMLAAPVSSVYPGMGKPGAHHLLRRGGDRRHRLCSRGVCRCAAGRGGGHLRQGVLPAGGRRARLRADGARAAVEARRPLQGDVSPRFVLVAGAAAALALFPLVGGKFGVDFVTKMMVFAIFALSLELLVGQVGLVCFGQAAFFGIAAYAVVLLTPATRAASVWWLLPAAIALAGLYALFVGSLSIRTRGAYFIMVTLAFSQMAYYVVHDTPLGGGTDGIYLNFVPTLDVAGHPLVDLGKPRPFYYFALACLAARIYLPRGSPAFALRPRARRDPRERAAHARRGFFPPIPTSLRPSCSRGWWPGWVASCSR